MAQLAQAQRAAERQRAAQVRANAQAQRAAERARAAYSRAAAADEREQKRLYIESRLAAVNAMNEDLTQTLSTLDGVLHAALSVDCFLDLNSLKQPTQVQPFDQAPFGQAQQPPDRDSFMPARPSGVGRLFGGAKYDKQVQQGQETFDSAVQEHQRIEGQRQHRIAAARATYDAWAAAQLADIRWKNGEVDELQNKLAAGAPDALATYLNLVLEAAAYPEGFAHEWRIAFVPDSAQLVIEFELPTPEVVPTVKAYKYVKITDSVTSTARPLSHVRAQYAALVAQTALRVVHEMLQADRGTNIGSVVFNGMVRTIDPATGKAIHPCLLTLRTTRTRFEELDLARVDPAACLRHLGAQVSRSPAELAAVRPVLEFDMVDPRFVDSDDVMAGLDTRPNLLEMSPTEFEQLIHNLFTKMGLETRLTRASRDGGVDCVAFDPRPIMGGKVVIQAKRYRHTVGVSAVRDLYGTLHNEGASKGILVTTSGYGQASQDFAANKPIELLDGSNLLYLLEKHAGIQARIEVPPDWQDPHPDTAETPLSSTPTQADPVGPIEPSPPFSPAIQLKAGQNISVETQALTIDLDNSSSTTEWDLSLLALNSDGKVNNDEDFVFYNQPDWLSGTITLHVDTPHPRCTINLQRVPPNTARIVIVASTDSAESAGVPRLHFEAAPDKKMMFLPALAGVMPALLCGEIYRRQSTWRFRAIGQGYHDGLAGLARDFGVSVE